jgi:DNA end-binding protein Ku
MGRAVWTGSLAFGLVTIPVRLYPATEPKDVRFHLTDALGRRVRYRRYVEAAEDADTEWEREPSTAEPDPAEPVERGATEAPRPAPRETVDEEIAFENLKRGYTFDDGRLVVLDAEEIEAVRPERSRTIEIEDFVDLADIDPVYFEKSYHLAPQRGSEKPYALLLRALEQAGRVGIGRFVLRTKPHLVAIRPADSILALETLFFGDEVRDGRELVGGVEAVEVSEKELGLAASLIEVLHTTWDPAAYSDTYREELLRQIAEKSPIEAPEEAAPAAAGSGKRVEELMEALKASVEAAKETRKKRPSRKQPA